MREIDIKLLIKKVNRQFNVNITSKSRKRKEVYLRVILMKMIYKKTNFSLEKIGSFFNRDHATVIHALKLYENVFGYSDFMELNDKVNEHKTRDWVFCQPCVLDNRNLLYLPK